MFERGSVRRWRTVNPTPWEVGSKGSGIHITIPAGTEFESSVPWWAVWFFHPDHPRFLLAALVHDYMLESGIYGRTQAAAEWYDAARAADAPSFRSKIGFVGIAIIAVFRG